VVQVHEQDDIDQLRALWLEDSGEEAPGSPFASQAASRAMNPATPSTQRSLLASFSAASVRRGGASVSDSDDGESEEALGPLELALASQSDGEAMFSPAQHAYIKAAAAQAVKDALADAMSWRLLLSTALFNAKRGAAGVSPRLAGAMERWLPNMLQRQAEEQLGG
jgi:hypothetical protein